MLDQTTSEIVIKASRAEVMDVIADFGAYPQWATGVKSCEVVETAAQGRAEQVRFVLDAAPIQDEYVLSYRWQDDSSVTWSLAEGGMIKGLDGAYVLEEQPGGATLVTYRISVNLALPLIGLLRRKAEKVIIDAALKGLKKRVEADG